MLKHDSKLQTGVALVDKFYSMSTLIELFNAEVVIFSFASNQVI